MGEWVKRRLRDYVLSSKQYANGNVRITNDVTVYRNGLRDLNRFTLYALSS